MFDRNVLTLMGSRIMVGGLTVIAVTLAIVIIDELATGGTQAILRTCVLFLWAALLAVVMGAILRLSGSRAFRSKPKPSIRPNRQSRRHASRH